MQNHIYLLKAPSYTSILKALPSIKNVLGSHLCAIEYVDGYTYQLSSQKLGLDLMQAE